MARLGVGGVEQTPFRIMQQVKPRDCMPKCVATVLHAAVRSERYSCPSASVLPLAIPSLVILVLIVLHFQLATPARTKYKNRCVDHCRIALFSGLHKLIAL